MLVHPPRVESCLSSGNLLIHAHPACTLNSVCILSVKNPGRGVPRTCRLRCRSSCGSSCTTQVERLGGGRTTKKRHDELRSCRVTPISAEVEGSSDVDGGQRHSSSSSAFEVEAVHDSATLLSNDSEAAAQDGEWRSLGRDGGVERLSTSSPRGNGLVAFNNNLSTISFGTELETIQSSVEWPVDHEGGTAAEEGRGARNVGGMNNNVNGTVPHPEVNNVPEEEEDVDVVESAQAGLAQKQLPVQQQKIKKRSSLGVRKPSQEPPPKIDQAPCTSHVNIAERHDDQAQPPPVPEPELDLQEDFDYYIPKVGEEVTGVVVSGNEYQLDIDIGSKHLGRMLSKDLKPLDSFRPNEFFWELDEPGTSMPATSLGQVRILGDREALRPTYPLVPVGTALSLQVYGVTASGRALLSARKIASRIAWQRVRQIHDQDEPIEAQCVAWSSDGLVFKIEGLRAVLPLNEFLNRSTISESLKDYVGEWKTILITDVDEATGKLLVSVKRAWGWRNLRIGSLVVGTVHKILPFGVEVILTGTSLRAILHISNISQCYIPDIKSVFTPGETLKALHC